MGELVLTEEDYLNKYLKYKEKYLSLKQDLYVQEGGDTHYAYVLIPIQLCPGNLIQLFNTFKMSRKTSSTLSMKTGTHFSWTLAEVIDQIIMGELVKKKVEPGTPEYDKERKPLVALREQIFYIRTRDTNVYRLSDHLRLGTFRLEREFSIEKNDKIESAYLNSLPYYQIFVNKISVDTSGIRSLIILAVPGVDETSSKSLSKEKMRDLINKIGRSCATTDSVEEGSYSYFSAATESESVKITFNQKLPPQQQPPLLSSEITNQMASDFNAIIRALSHQRTSLLGTVIKNNISTHSPTWKIFKITYNDSNSSLSVKTSKGDEKIEDLTYTSTNKLIETKESKLNNIYETLHQAIIHNGWTAQGALWIEFDKADSTIFKPTSQVAK